MLLVLPSCELVNSDIQWSSFGDLLRIQTVLRSRLSPHFLDGFVQRLPVFATLRGRGAVWSAVRRGVGRAILATLLAWGAPSEAWDPPKVLAHAQKMGPAALARAQALLGDIAEVADRDDETRLKTINGFFNRRILYRDDMETWGQVDYWATPLELLAKGQGDCEDYAIAKYFSLLAAGVSGPKMRLVYVRAEVGSAIQAHMVLAYYASPNAEPLILDNLITEIRPASRRPDLIPVFSFSAEGLWQGVGATSAGDPAVRLSKWRDVLAKIKAEGWW